MVTDMIAIENLVVGMWYWCECVRNGYQTCQYLGEGWFLTWNFEWGRWKEERGQHYDADPKFGTIKPYFPANK